MGKKSRKASTKKPRKVTRAKPRSQPQQEESGFLSSADATPQSGGGIYGF